MTQQFLSFSNLYNLQMESIRCGPAVTCSIRKPPVTAPFHHLRSSLSSTFKPLLKEWKLRIQVPETVKRASTNLMDAFVDSMFKFVEQPMLLQGNFAPVSEIGETVVVPSIEGEIPKDFPEGVYIRNGPNPIFADKTAVISIFGKSTLLWFEGDGMLHATYFSKDKRENWVVTYKNRYVEAETFMVEKEKKKALFLPATEGDSSAVVAAYILNLLRFGKVNKDLNNTNLFKHAGKVYSITENHMPYEVDVSNLETLNDWELKDAWNRPFTSHPKIDMKTGEMVAMGIDAKKPYYVLGIISADGKKLIHKVDLKFEKSTLSHELGVTENYNIIIDYPLIIDVGRLIRGGSLIKYERDQRARIGVMPRYGDVDSVVWFSIKNHCTFHIINSFEEGDEVVVIGCRAIGSIVPGPDHGTNKQEWFRRAFRPVSAVTEGFDPSVDGVVFPRPYEWRLNVKTGAVEEGYLTGTNFAMDFPTINDTFMGMKNKYGYTQVLDSVQSSKTGLSAFNLFAKLYFEERKKPVIKEGEDWIKVEYHVLEENQFCSGLQFIPKPGGIDEDDGWLICYVHDEKTNISQVHIIDAKNFTEKPVAKITLPQRVPYGYHGTFICK